MRGERVQASSDEDRADGADCSDIGDGSHGSEVDDAATLDAANATAAATTVSPRMSRRQLSTG